MSYREYLDGWVLLVLAVGAIVFSIKLSRAFSTMNSLEVAGVVFNVLLTFGLLAIYWELSSTQEQQKEIMDKQENLMAANHSPRIRVFDHQVSTFDDEEIQTFVLANEGNGPAVNLKAGCQILLRLESDSDLLPFYIPMESFDIRSYPNPLIKIVEENEPADITGDSWLNTYEPGAFYSELTFFEMNMVDAKSKGIRSLVGDKEYPAELEGDWGFSFEELMEELPVEDADAVTFRFFIEYEYADGRSDKKRAPIFVVPVKKVNQCTSFSEAIEHGFRIPHIAPASFAASDTEHM